MGKFVLKLNGYESFKVKNMYLRNRRRWVLVPLGDSNYTRECKCEIETVDARVQERLKLETSKLAIG